MKYYILNTIKTMVLFSVLFLAGSCALKSISSEYAFVNTDFKNADLNKLGNGKILIYNGADLLHKVDNTARLNIWINDKQLGQLRGSEYVVIDLKGGMYKFKVLHIDMFNMRSTHEIEIDKETKVIRIKPTATSNKLTIINELPKNFSKFKYAEK